ncbi:S1C family serine protease [Gracilibacillus dipsosauri]|uniref:Serine protease n=1 Tax=Gracilibacillus dipsosauri TaxID=178340 RepID=A0A317L0A1_9BACI|nr:S1C family serine protease [Gracilibacillus dipsosauri]PWU69023.1 serine protease [Gracilibacillus dipsosauri]
MKNKTNRLTLIISFLILLATIAVAVFWIINRNGEPLQVENNLVTNVSSENNHTNLKSIIHNAQKAIVQIQTNSGVSQKTGSGFIFNSKGDIVTNAHVVEDADSIIVSLSNTQKYPAALVAIGEKEDIAIIRVPELKYLDPLPYEEDYQAEIGDEIIAIGSPVGIQNTVSLGLIVGTDRSFTIEQFQYDHVYQISANITHGNSGGPLILRKNGKVIGINSAGIDDTDIGFSIPMNNVFKQLKDWTESVDEEKLDYQMPTTATINQEKFKEDAKYITEYFFDSINLRDYINAYTLLDSDLQSKVTYTKFREAFSPIVKLNVNEVLIEDRNEEQLKIVAKLEITTRDKSYNEKKETHDYPLIIGLENDQIKILKYGDDR